MKKFLIGTAITIFALVVISGAFAGGFLVGHFYPAEQASLPFLPAETQVPAQSGDNQGDVPTTSCCASPVSF